MQLAPAVVQVAAGQDGSWGRHRRAAALTAHANHRSSLHHVHHGHHAAPTQQGILSAFLRKRAASAHTRNAATTCAVLASAAVATAQEQQQQQQQQQQYAPDLGYPRTLLQDLVLLQTIGKGGNGVVVLAKRRDEEAEGTAPRTLAVKSIPKVLKEGSELKRANHLKAVQREITVLKRLRGSLNIVSLEGVYEDDTHVHLVMEHCSGGELTAAIGERHHSERAVASYMRAVLKTLAQCHAHHILHRDVKPGNFMLLSTDERAPLRAIDFGLAVPFDPEELPRTDLGLEGTPWFMAPEVLSSKVLPASDLWSAGVMCFQLLTGRMPFDDKLNPGNPSINAIWRSILFDELDFTKPWWRGMSPECKDFVRLLLQRDPERRPTAKEALKHPWLVGDVSDRSAGRKLQRSVVARIQRFAGSSVFKRSVLQMIAMELQRHPECQFNSHGSADWSASLAATGSPTSSPNSSSSSSSPSSTGTCNPVPASLAQLYATLNFDPQTDDAPAHEVAAAIKRLGFRLTDDEVERLLEQLDPAQSGRVARAALAASQMDWRQLQAQDRRRWVDVARRVFSALDKDADGLLQVRELTEHVLRTLPGDEVEMADLVRQAVEEAAAAEHAAQHEPRQGLNHDEDEEEVGQGGTSSSDDEVRRQQQQLLRAAHVASVDALLQAADLSAGAAALTGGHGNGTGQGAGMDFEGFLRMLKASSVDSLDMYDDRATVGGSLNSVDRANSLLHRSGTNTTLASMSGSRHGTRHGAASLGYHSSSVESSGGVLGGGGSVHNGVGGGGSVHNGGAAVWRFDVGGAGALAAGGGGGARAAASAPVPIAGAKEKQAAAAWRFDVAGAGSGVAAPAAAPVPAWRFDVAGRSGAAGAGAGAGTGVVAGATVGGGPAAVFGSDAVAVSGIHGGGSSVAAVAPAGVWRFDVGERAAAVAAASPLGRSLLSHDDGAHDDGSVPSSHDEGSALVAAAAAMASPGERSGGGGGGGSRAPLGGWYDGRQHGSKLYAAALGRRGPGVLPPVNE